MVRLRSAAKDTEAITRVTNNAAPVNPGRVIISFMPIICIANRDSPGVKTLKSAGMTIKREKSGIHIHVLLRKNPIFTLEKYARIKHTAYRQMEIAILLARSTARINRRKVIALILGSKDCKNPSFAAYSSEKTDSLRKDRVPVNERSMKLLFFDN